MQGVKNLPRYCYANCVGYMEINIKSYHHLHCSGTSLLDNLLTNQLTVSSRKLVNLQTSEHADSEYFKNYRISTLFVN